MSLSRVQLYLPLILTAPLQEQPLKRIRECYNNTPIITSGPFQLALLLQIMLWKIQHPVQALKVQRVL